MEGAFDCARASPSILPTSAGHQVRIMRFTHQTAFRMKLVKYTQ